jgi:hypothetical protein
MIILSLPFLCIFIIGCYSMYLTNIVYDEMAARRKEKESDAKLN